MDENLALSNKRAEINRQLEDEIHITFGRLLANRVGAVVQRITVHAAPTPFWVSITIIVGMVMLLGNLLSLLFDGSFFFKDMYLQLALWSVSLIVLIALEAFVDALFALTQAKLLDAITSIDDLIDLQQQFTSIFSQRKQLWIGGTYALALTWAAIDFSLTTTGDVRIGFIISIMILNLICGSYVSFAFTGLPALLHFSQYQYNLFTVEPARSEVIIRLSNLLSRGVYIGAMWGTFFTTFMILSGRNARLWQIAMTVFTVGWAPTIALFVLSQTALSRMITNAKWRTLNAIQAQIEELHAEEPILGEKRLEQINKLLDYHDRIAATRNSALNLRAALNFVNSLLLPVIALLLANLDKIIALLFG